MKATQGREDVDEMADRVHDTYKINANLMNARQAFLNVKQGTPKIEIPKIKGCEKEAPEEINVYSDGSLISIRTNSFKLAGAGVWWPNRKNMKEQRNAFIRSWGRACLGQPKR